MLCPSGNYTTGLNDAKSMSMISGVRVAARGRSDVVIACGGEGICDLYPALPSITIFLGISCCGVR